MSRAREKRRREIIQSFVEAYSKHIAAPSGHSWCETGVRLSDAYESDVGEAALTAANARLDPARFTPIHCWQKATKLHPGHATAWLRMGRAYREIWDDQRKAKRCFGRAVEADPSLVEAWVGMGFATLPPAQHDLTDRKLRKLVFETEAYLTRAIAESVQEATAHDVFLYLAECAWRLSDDAQAVRWYGKGAATGSRWYQHEHAKLERKLKKKG